MPTINSFPYHRQDEKTQCGPACAQMVLSYLRTNQTLPKQVDLRQDADKLGAATNPTWQKYDYDAWATRPDELKHTLGLRQQSFNVAFEAYYYGKAKDYLPWLRNRINNTTYQTYPIVPVHGTFYYKKQLSSVIEAKGYSNLVTYDAKSDYDAHWIVLFKHDSNGFVGNDPYFPLTKGADVHANPDVCKTVLIHINGSDTAIGDYNFPVINRAAVSWASSPGGIPGGRIGWQPPSEASPIQPPLLPPPPLPMMSFDAPNRAFDETSVRRQMDSFGLFTNPPCNAYLSGTSFGTPRLVRRLDVIGRDYYLVPMLKPSGNSSAMVRVDAPTGIYLDSLYYSENPFIFDKGQLRQMRWEATLKQIAQFDNRLLNPFITQINEPATEMVWLPCKESRSAFFPFYVIKVLDRRVLVRVDWILFMGLTY
ncbi:MAG: hypothetical protein HYR56_21380 [Acidobacteria bacterium]|nr:hypothetical protein [Acidobacteriota bacterium]MBI3427638.1 hypothetical protein [Acidobacteriota bacterium]